jgi:Flp pilus assembly protein TadG
VTARGGLQDGSATVEFVLFALLLLVPFTYVLLAVFEVQRAAYGTTQAAREAARAFVTSPTGSQARGRMQAAVALALADQGLDANAVTVTVRCSADPCLTPGATVTVLVDEVVALPWVPSLLGHLPASLQVRAAHVQTVDLYIAARP